ncbi:MutS domain V [Flavobacteriaceae bacterium MAR_2010_188]|nr:MutS domain V [Flavobacteriaceae bacterium MAR_2010_188]
MLDTNSYYQNNVAQYTREISSLHKKLITYSTLRVLAFVATALGIYFTYSSIVVVFAIVIVGIAVFLYLLAQYTDLKKKHDFKEALLEINERELKIGAGKYHELFSGTKYKDPNHFYCEDIDLFGIGSFFQYINRTKISSGADKLAEYLLANDVEGIKKRQDSIKELAEMPEWNQDFTANAQLIKVSTTSSKIEAWLTDYVPFLSSKLKWLPLAFSIGSFIIIALTILDIVSISILSYWFFLGLIISGRFLKGTNNLSVAADMARDTIIQYSVLMKQIEKTEFKTENLKENRNRLFKTDKKASVLFKKFASALNGLDNRNNLIYGVFGNGFFLADLYNVTKVENWIIKNKSLIPEWFSVVAYFDAQVSLGTFGFNHPQFNYPQLTDDSYVIKAKDLGHPLLKTEKRIDNDLAIHPEEFFIITGANMAGKSTFLRTVSLYIVMANTGLPVCAKESVYSPVKLITSMRTSDSLKDESSYFFSELSRLKFIVDAIKIEPYFIILDEILKGTNSTDKAIGSRKFVQKLVNGNATGLIATHDLSLCEIEEDLSDVKNYYFDAQIIDDELYFDYTFKKGICKNMNASFLLKKMEII